MGIEVPEGWRALSGPAGRRRGGVGTWYGDGASRSASMTCSRRTVGMGQVRPTGQHSSYSTCRLIDTEPITPGRAEVDAGGLTGPAAAGEGACGSTSYTCAVLAYDRG